VCICLSKKNFFWTTLACICWILSQFLNVHFFKLLGDLHRGGCALFCSACKKLRCRPKYSLLTKLIRTGQSSCKTVLLVNMDQVHRTFFTERGRNRCRSHVFPISDISIHSGDICDWRYLWSKSDDVRNHVKFCRFLAPRFLLGWGLGSFWTWIIKRNQSDKVSRRSAEEAQRFHGKVNK